MPGAELPPLPPQPPDVPWPTRLWPVCEPSLGICAHGAPPTVDVDVLDRQVATLFSRRHRDRLGETLALVAVQGGRILAERYAAGIAADRTLISWSTAKSMLHAAVGILVGRGLLDLDAPAVLPEWSSADDPRRAITLRHLLQFRSGLEWAEDYVDAGQSDVIEMLFGAGQADTAAFAAAKPLAHEPGTQFCYSSGTSNIVSRIVRDVVAADAGVDADDPEARATASRDFLHRELFDPLGMRSTTLRFDEAGTWVASSYAFCTARDFARFATLYLRDGVWEGHRLLPEGWVDQARTEVSHDIDGMGHGAHWWTWAEVPGAFSANGYEGQYLVVVPDLDVVVVRLGKTPVERRPALRAELSTLIEALRP